MGALSEEVRQRMMARMARLREEQWGGTPRWDLSGRKAIVEPGRSVVIRFMPRWDYAMKFIDGNKRNPSYKEGEIFFEAAQHWYDGPDNQRQVDWCLKTRFPGSPELEQERCPICEGVEQLRLSSDKPDQEQANNNKANTVFLFNAMLGETGKRRFTDQQKPDIRLLIMNTSLTDQLVNIMSGGDNRKFAREDVSDSRDGYDIMLWRPAKNSGDRWKLEAAKDPSPLFLPEEREAYRGWSKMLLDLPKLVQTEMRSYVSLYKRYNNDVEPPSDAPGFETNDLDGDVEGGREEEETMTPPVAAGSARRPAPVPVDADDGDVPMDDSAPDFDMPDDAAEPPPPPARRAAPVKAATPPSRSAPSSRPIARGAQPSRSRR